MRPSSARSFAQSLALIGVIVGLAACQASTSSASPSGGPSASGMAPFDPYGKATGGVATLSYPSRTVFVQLFEWKWTDIAKECEQWLGPRGFSAVQISPPQEHAEIDTADNHFPWWERYQAVSYQLDSRSGTRAEFADMVSRCRSAGVEIYADVILNHMSAGSGTGSAGTHYTKYDYPGLYGPEDFHANPNPAYPDILCTTGITNNADPANVQTCELSGLADLRTEEPKVQEAEAGYLADLYGLGVRGFRIDAAKHIDHLQLAAILARFESKIPAGAHFFVDQEVTDYGGDALPKDQYYATGEVEDFVYAVDLGQAFTSSDSNLAQLQKLDAAGFIGPSDRSVVFVDNHDSQRGHVSGIYLSYKRGPLYVLANVFMLAYPFGDPRVMSSFVFTDTEAGPPSDGQGHTNDVYLGGGSSPNCGLTLGQWVCEQRWHAIAAMVGFRDFTASSAQLTDWWSNPANPNQIAFGRGSAGFVVINKSSSPLSETLHTSMAAGRYCDVISGDLLSNGKCSGAEITVESDGTARVQVPAMSAEAIHTGARAS